MVVRCSLIHFLLTNVNFNKKISVNLIEYFFFAFYYRLDELYNIRIPTILRRIVEILYKIVEILYKIPLKNDIVLI